MHMPPKTCENAAEPGQVAQCSADTTWTAIWHQWTRGVLFSTILVTALSVLCGGLQLCLPLMLGNSSDTDRFSIKIKPVTSTWRAAASPADVLLEINPCAPVCAATPQL